MKTCFLHEDCRVEKSMDSPHYWDNFWETDGGLGVGGCDPDSASKTLQKYHQILWSRTLPCGKEMRLKCGSGPYYLTWEDFRFASDSIIVDFRYVRYTQMLERVRQVIPDYRAFVEDFVRQSYTIGGTIIFPKHTKSALYVCLSSIPSYCIFISFSRSYGMP